jgi:hypothetical protein
MNSSLAGGLQLPLPFPTTVAAVICWVAEPSWISTLISHTA